jgi:hypothetical protein
VRRKGLGNRLLEALLKGLSADRHAGKRVTRTADPFGRRYASDHPILEARQRS